MSKSPQQENPIKLNTKSTEQDVANRCMRACDYTQPPLGSKKKKKISESQQISHKN